jgi:hypothetical protein
MAVADVNPEGFPDNPPIGARGRRRAVLPRAGARSLGFDRFFSSGIPGMPGANDLPQISGDQTTVQGVWGALQGIGMAYLTTVMNSAPIFRVAIATWAVAVLQGLLASLDTMELSETNRNTPAGRAIILLKQKVKSLIAQIGQFAEAGKLGIESDRRLSKLVNEVAKPAG